jgi:hypothetical protein
MNQMGDVHKKRGANIMKTGAGMLVFGIAIALFSAGENGNAGLNGFSSFVAIAGFIVLIVGVGKYRETPAGD